MYLVTWTTRDQVTGQHVTHSRAPCVALWDAHSTRQAAFEQYRTLVSLPFIYAVCVAQPIASTDYRTFQELAA